MSERPDSRVPAKQDVQVRWTEEYDNPAYGAVSVSHTSNGYSYTVLRMSVATAIKLRDQLTEHLGVTE